MSKTLFSNGCNTTYYGTAHCFNKLKTGSKFSLVPARELIFIFLTEQSCIENDKISDIKKSNNRQKSKTVDMVCQSKVCYAI